MARMIIRNFKICVLSILGIIMFLVPIQANSVSTQQENIITIYYHNEDVPIVGAQFDVFHLGVVNESNSFTASDVFKDSNIDFRISNTSNWRDLAVTLEGYILRDNIDASFSGKTDEQGQLQFRVNDDKEQDLYLIIGSRHTQDDCVYNASAVIICFDQENDSDDRPLELVIQPKFRILAANDSVESIDIKATKIWRDQGYETIRPEEITVQLLKNGIVFDDAVLSKDNDWTFAWENLDATASWHITEVDENDYLVFISHDNNRFFVSNTYAGQEIPLPDSTEPADPSLPQSGQVWWPVPVLIILGFLFLLLGSFCKRGTKDESL